MSIGNGEAASVFSPPSSAEESSSRAARDPNYGIKSFKLQPAPRHRHSARARSPRGQKASGPGADRATPQSETNSDNCGSSRGKFHEHISWEVHPSSAQLDSINGVEVPTSGSTPATSAAEPDSESSECGQHSPKRRRPSVPHSVADGTLTSSFMGADEEHVRSTSGAMPSDGAGAEDSADQGLLGLNERLSFRAGSVASSRRSQTSESGDGDASILVGINFSPPRRSTLKSPTKLLQRLSSSSTIFCRSPSSPVAGSQHLGKRGMERAEKQREATVLSFPPMSPLTPTRAEALHTPMAREPTEEPAPSTPQANGRLKPGSDIDDTPLSALLRELGAKRATMLYACNDVMDDINLPDWAVKQRSSLQKQQEAIDGNKQAIDEFRQLKIEPMSVDSAARGGFVGLPSLTVAGDLSVNSPNGRLLSGETLSPALFSSQDWKSGDAQWAKPPASTLKPLTLRQIRSRANNAPKIQSSVRASPAPLQGVSMAKHVSDIVDAIKTSTGARSRRADPNIQYMRSDAVASKLTAPPNEEKRDGWGGVLTRCSWFRNGTKGPLVSPFDELSKVPPPVPPLPTNAAWLAQDAGQEAAAVLQKPSSAVKKEERRARFKSLSLVKTYTFTPSSTVDTGTFQSQSKDSSDDLEVWEDLSSASSSSHSFNGFPLSARSDETMVATASPLSKPLLERATPRFVGTKDPTTFSRRDPASSDEREGDAECKKGLGVGWSRLFALGRPSSESMEISSPAKPQTGKFLYNGQVFVLDSNSAKSTPKPTTTTTTTDEKGGWSSSCDDGSTRDGEGHSRSIVRYGKSSIESTPVPPPPKRWGGWRLLILVTLLLLLSISVGFNAVLISSNNKKDDGNAALVPTTLPVPRIVLPTPAAMPTSTLKSDLPATGEAQPTPVPAPAPASGDSTASRSATADSAPLRSDSRSPTPTSESSATTPSNESDGKTAADYEDEMEREGRTSMVRQAVQQSQPHGSGDDTTSSAGALRRRSVAPYRAAESIHGHLRRRALGALAMHHSS